jgi:hypothetical protein
LSSTTYNYWSSTTKSNNTSNAWNVNLNNGNTNNNNKTNDTSYRVRCVRKLILAQGKTHYMAQYSHLSIYIKTYEFIKYVYRIIQQFRKEYKHTLGAEIQQILWQILDEIIKTNSLPDNQKKDGIQKISYLFDKFKIRFRFAFEIGLMTNKKFGIAQQQIEEIGRMIGGWFRWTVSH